MSIENPFSKVERDAWRPPGDFTVSQWADKPGNRILDPDTSAEAGQYSSARTPYIRGPMDAFTDTEVEEIDVMSAGQVAKSTAIQNMIANPTSNRFISHLEASGPYAPVTPAQPPAT